MTTLPDRLRPATTPLPPPDSVVRGDSWRITVLTERLFRFEYSPTGRFEDRATQTVVHRAFPPVPFTVVRDGEKVRVRTAGVTISYDGRPFSPTGLIVQLSGGTGHGITWRYGTTPRNERQQPANLGGTARTLDEVDGACPLEPGIMSEFGVEVLDDSTSLALDESGWVAPRVPGGTDVYVFAHGHDFRGALRDFYALTGPQPLLPRYALGNWWSRYHPYSAS